MVPIVTTHGSMKAAAAALASDRTARGFDTLKLQFGG
jgi:hypothetical protein